MFAEEDRRAIIINRYVLDTNKRNDYLRFQSFEHVPPNGAWKQTNQLQQSHHHCYRACSKSVVQFNNYFKNVINE